MPENRKCSLHCNRTYRSDEHGGVVRHVLRKTSFDEYKMSNSVQIDVTCNPGSSDTLFFFAAYSLFIAGLKTNSPVSSQYSSTEEVNASKVAACW